MDKSEFKGFAYENELARQVLAAQKNKQAGKLERLKSQLVSLMTRNSRSLHKLVPQKRFDEAYFNSYWATAFSDGLADFAAKSAENKAKSTIRDCIWGNYVAPLSYGVSLDFVTSWQGLPAAALAADAAGRVADILCLADELKRRQAKADEKKINQTNFIKYKQKLLATAEKCQHSLDNRWQHFSQLVAAKPMLQPPEGQLPALSQGEKENLLAVYLHFSQIKEAFAKGEESDKPEKSSYDGMLFSVNFNKTKLLFAMDDTLPVYASRTQTPAYLGMSFYNMFFMFYRKASSYRTQGLAMGREQEKYYPARRQKLHDYLMEIYYANKEQVDAYYAGQRVAVSKDISNKARNLHPDNDNAWQLLVSWGVSDKYPDAQAQIAAIKQSVDVGYSLQAKKRVDDYIERLQLLEAYRKLFTSEEQDYLDYWVYRISIDIYKEFGGTKQRGLGQYQSKWFKARYKRIIDFYTANAASAGDKEAIINSYLASCGKGSIDRKTLEQKLTQVLSRRGQN